MKRIFLILLVCCIASLKAVGQNEVFIYEMTSYYKIQEEKEYQVGTPDKLRLCFLPEKKLKVAETTNGKYFKMDDGSIIEDSYKFYKVDENGDVWYEHESYQVGNSSITMVIRLSPDRNRLESYFISKKDEKINTIERYVLKSKEDKESEKLPSWLK